MRRSIVRSGFIQMCHMQAERGSGFSRICHVQVERIRQVRAERGIRL